MDDIFSNHGVLQREEVSFLPILHPFRIVLGNLEILEYSRGKVKIPGSGTVVYGSGTVAVQ